MTLDGPEVRAFVARSMVARVATLSRKGEPHITPLWFVCDQETIYMTTREASPAARNISMHPAVVLLFDVERGPGSDRVLRIRGRAIVSKESGLLRRIALRVGRKYYLCPGGLRNLLAHCQKLPLMRRYYGERRGQAGVIEVEPEGAEFLKRVEEQR